MGSVEPTVVGTLGRVVIPTRGALGCGEVVVRIANGSEAIIAWSAEPLPVGTEVLVVNHRGPRQYDVEPWHDLFHAPAVLPE